MRSRVRSPAPWACWVRCAWTTRPRWRWWSWWALASPTCSPTDRATPTRTTRTVMNENKQDAGVPQEPEPAVTTEPQAPDAAEFAAETARADAMRPTPEAPDYKDKWLRAEAEIQNVRRRLMREREDAVRVSEDRVLLDVIGLLDDLERAVAALPPEQAAGPWAQGVALTAQRMRD